MKIPGILYLAVGGFVVWFSNYTVQNSKFETAQFTVFVWLGYAFIAFGGLKIIWGLLTRPRKKKVHHHKPYHGSHHPSAVANFCDKCGQEASHLAHFCQNCGNKILHKK